MNIDSYVENRGPSNRERTCLKVNDHLYFYKGFPSPNPSVKTHHKWGQNSADS